MSQQTAGGFEPLVYQSTLPLSKQTVEMVARLIRDHRTQLGSRWRKASPGRQALLVLVILRHDQRLADLAAGNDISAATLRRWTLETIRLLAARAPRLSRVLRRLRTHGAELVLLDGTLVRTRRRTGKANRRNYSGKHKRHGLNVQALTDPEGNLLWVSAALPGKTADITAARRLKLLDRLRTAGLALAADKGYHGFHKDLHELAKHLSKTSDPADSPAPEQIVITPYKAQVNHPLTNAQHTANSVFNSVRCAAERGFATLKTWRILNKLRLAPRHATTLLRALLVLTQHEHNTRHP